MIVYPIKRYLKWLLAFPLLTSACDLSKSSVDEGYTLVPDDRFVVLLEKEISSLDVDSSSYFSMPMGIVSSAKNGNIYVSSAEDDQIYVLDKSLAVVDTIGKFGQGPGELRDPAYLYIKDDYLYVVEWGNNRISRFTLSGGFVNTIKIPMTLQGTNVAIDSKNRIHVFDPASQHLISVLKDNGERIISFGDLVDAQGGNIKNLNRPLLVMDELDNLYVVYISQYKIIKYNKSFEKIWERDYSDFPAFVSYQAFVSKLLKSGTVSVGKQQDGKPIAGNISTILAFDSGFFNGNLYVIYAGHQPHGAGIYEIDASNGEIKKIYLHGHENYGKKLYRIPGFCFNDKGKILILAADGLDGQVILFQ